MRVEGKDLFGAPRPIFGRATVLYVSLHVC